MNEKKIEQPPETIKIDHGIFNYFPAILDYDFEKKRPRGLSSRIDFFSYGAICNILDDIELMPHVFVKKQHTFFENGMILADFSKVEESPASFVKMIKNLKYNKIYLEHSKRFPLDKALSKLKNVEIVFLGA